jgi:hypothetical protein
MDTTAVDLKIGWQVPLYDGKSARSGGGYRATQIYRTAICASWTGKRKMH